MIDIHTERIVSIPEAARVFPAVNGRAMNYHTIYRWMMRGKRVGGVVVRLDHLKLNAVVTSIEAIDRFIAATNAGRIGSQTADETPVLRIAPRAVGPPPLSRRAVERTLSRFGITT